MSAHCHARRCAACGALALVLSIGTAQATTILVHNGALDPVADEGWSNYTSPNTSTTAGPVYNDLGSGYDAWAVDDNSTAADTLRYYYEDLTTGQVTEGNTDGWRLSVRLRIVNTSDGFVTVSGYGLASTVTALYRDGVRDWYLGFGSQADGDPLIRLPNSSGGTYAFEGGGSGYHIYELVYDPVALSADFFIDGVEKASNIVANTTSFGQKRVQWGAGTSPDAGQGNFSFVRFATSSAPYVVPVPGAAWLFASALGAVAAIRRSALARDLQSGVARQRAPTGSRASALLRAALTQSHSRDELNT